MSLIYFLAVLSILVIIHEFGHFIVAKRLGVGVERFSIGFGPKLFSKKVGETEYIVSAILLGGYVKMAGDDPGEKLENKSWEFLSRSVIDRFRIIVSGPVCNYVLGFLIFSIVFMIGSPVLTTEVGSTLKNYPAEAAGLRVGDVVKAVDGKPVKYWEDMTAIIHKKTDGSSLNLSIERAITDPRHCEETENAGVSTKQSITINIKPVVRKTKDLLGKNVELALVGIAPSQKIEKARYGFFKSFSLGLKKTIDFTVVTYKALFSIVIGRLSLKESMTGPIGIFVITGQAAKLGFIYIFHLMGALSLSLAIFNLLPLPVLDGGHIIFLAIEKIMGRPLKVKTQEAITNVGIAFLVLLSVLVFYGDFVKFGLIEKMFGLFKSK